ncbi:MAG: AMP-binding protein [Xanthomonadales bacterium]|nr:AMP-binding protein [Xanthomonadales bacterium]
MTGWNFADVFDAVARAVPGRAAVIEPDGTVCTWRAFERRAAALAEDLVESGVGRHERVAIMLRNSAAYLETCYATFKAGLTPVNVNYRYGVDEVDDLLADAGAVALVYHGEFRGVVDELVDRGASPAIRYEVADVDAGVGEGARSYASTVTRECAFDDAPWGRSGSDLVLLYTGGTTGRPKGVMWRQDDLFRTLLASGNDFRRIPVPTSADQLAASAVAGGGVRDLPACPMMHATGLFNSFMTLAGGGTTVVLPGSSFHASTLWKTVARERVELVVIVGDAFAVPMVDSLVELGASLDLDCLAAVVSSGAAFRRSTKEALLTYLPHIAIVDAFGSSEASGIGWTVSRAGDVRDSAEFSLNDHVRVIADDGTWFETGEQGTGKVAFGGILPLGYHNDPDKTAETFQVIDGRRYAIPGDHVRVDEDGTLHLLGRGSACINTGGEKVYPEEVDECLREHPDVADVGCVGIPDARFGQVICAVVAGRSDRCPSADELADHVRGRLAAYKAPRKVVEVDEVPRLATGKLDYPALTALAT